MREGEGERERESEGGRGREARPGEAWSGRPDRWTQSSLHLSRGWEDETGNDADFLGLSRLECRDGFLDLGMRLVNLSDCWAL